MRKLSVDQTLLLMALFAAVIMLLGTAWIGDDAFITLRVIDNFVNGFGLRYNVIERVQAYTHPLWLFFLTPFYALTREPMVTTMLVSVALSMGALWLLATRIATRLVYGSVLILAAMMSRSIYQFSTSGLESPLSFMLVALFVWLLHGRPEKPWLAAACAGFLFLNRLDLAILIGPALAAFWWEAGKRHRIRTGLAVVLPALVWIVFSIIYYGAPFPNTAYAKLGTGFDAGTLIVRGLEYCREFVFSDPLLALIMGKAIFDAFRSTRRTTRLLGVGIVLYCCYIISIGGDFMSGRFFAPPGFLAICLLAQNPVPQWLEKNLKPVFVGALVILVILLATRLLEPPRFTIPDDGISDERRFYYTTTGLLPVLRKWAHTGSEPVPSWGVRGVELRQEAQRTGKSIVAIEGNTGMFGYYAGPAIHNIDVLALSDAFLARLPAAPGSRTGHYMRIVTREYAESSLKPLPTIEIESLRPLLSDVTLATRAPLFERGRWAAIWRLMSGQYSWVYHTDALGMK